MWNRGCGSFPAWRSQTQRRRQAAAARAAAACSPQLQGLEGGQLGHGLPGVGQPHHQVGACSAARHSTHSVSDRAAPPADRPAANSSRHLLLFTQASQPAPLQRRWRRAASFQRGEGRKTRGQLLTSRHASCFSRVMPAGMLAMPADQGEGARARQTELSSAADGGGGTHDRRTHCPCAHPAS